MDEPEEWRRAERPHPPDPFAEDQAHDEPASSATQQVCFTCGEPLDTHPRCRVCTILIGPGHIETTMVDGRCSSCLGFQERHPKRQR